MESFSLLMETDTHPLIKVFSRLKFEFQNERSKLADLIVRVF